MEMEALQAIYMEDIEGGRVCLTHPLGSNSHLNFLNYSAGFVAARVSNQIGARRQRLSTYVHISSNLVECITTKRSFA